MTHPAALAEDKLLTACELTQTRGSGPGGQHRNKTQTKIVLRHRPTGIEAQAGERRSQADNRRVAARRLRLELALGVRADRGPASELWESRRSGSTIKVNPNHADYPAVLAEALDMLSAHGGDTPKAAATLGVSTSQLVKLLKGEPRALALLNQWRAERGLTAMK